MMSSYTSIFSVLSLNRALLLLGSVLFSLVSIVLMNKGLLPLDPVTFGFFSFVLFLFALYRPGWVFLLLIGVLPLEIVNVAPDAFGGTMLRPYQWLVVLLFIALGLRFVSKRLPFQMFRPRLFDVLPILIALGAFIAVPFALDSSLSLKQALVLTSFVALYFLGRIFFRTRFDVLQALPFFITSSLVVFFYALWQNVVFLSHGTSFQVMAGRPNSAFSEADWLGMFAVVALSVGYALLSTALSKSIQTVRGSVAAIASFLFLTLTFIVLIITVARSAWLGAAVVTLLFVLGLLLERGVIGVRLSFRKSLPFLLSLVVSFSIAAGAVVAFHLSPFQFLNRLESTASGWQKITVSCMEDTVLPERISDLAELEPLSCRHITLEAIEEEMNAGNVVKEVSRPDPNVSIRREIYDQVWGIAKNHPLTGIGWGSAAAFLGTDERGAGLNASNIFLEIWLGSGLLGLIAFMTLWFLLVWSSIRWYRESSVGDVCFPLFLLSVLFGTTVFNLFNSGILLGFYFILLSILVLAAERVQFSKKNDYE